MEKILSVFIDESGDFGFIKDASKYYLIILVFHDQKDNISSNIERIKDKPVFHAGPIIRRDHLSKIHLSKIEKDYFNQYLCLQWVYQ